MKGDFMQTSRTFVLIAVTAAALFAGSASAQKSKVAPAQAFYDDGVQLALPNEDATSTLKLEGLKTVHAAWLTFAKFQDGSVASDPQVIALMEGVTAKWSGPKSCTYDLKLVANPPAINMTKSSKVCALRPGESATFRVLAM